LDTEPSDDKDIQKQLWYQYCAANKLRASFSRCSNAVKNVFSVPFACPCMHHNYGVFSGSQACRDCVWHIILDVELYTTCPGERVLVATKFNVTFLPLRLCYCYENTRTCFSKDAVNLTTYGYVPWCNRIVSIRTHSLNTIYAFYSVNEWSKFAVSVWLMACHGMPQCFCILPRLNQFRNWCTQIYFIPKRWPIGPVELSFFSPGSNLWLCHCSPCDYGLGVWCQSLYRLAKFLSVSGPAQCCCTVAIRILKM